VETNLRSEKKLDLGERHSNESNEFKFYKDDLLLKKNKKNPKIKSE